MFCLCFEFLLNILGIQICERSQSQAPLPPVLNSSHLGDPPKSADVSYEWPHRQKFRVSCYLIWCQRSNSNFCSLFQDCIVRSMAKTLVDICAYSGTENVLKIQSLLETPATCWSNWSEVPLTGGLDKRRFRTVQIQVTLRSGASIKSWNNGYQIAYLGARVIGQAPITKTYLQSVS